jgi:hypothetical protein
MSDYNNTEWDGTAGAFPSRYDYDHNKRPIMNKDLDDDDNINISDEDDSKNHHIFVDNNNDVFPDDDDGPLFDSLETVNDGSRECEHQPNIASSLSHDDGLMNVSHSSSSMTPAISNTTTANVVREAIKKSKEQLQKSKTKTTTTTRGEESNDNNRGEGGVSGGCFYPYNMFRSLSKGKKLVDEGRNEKKKKETTRNNSNNGNNNGNNNDNNNDNDKGVVATATVNSHHVPSYNKTKDYYTRETDNREQQQQQQQQQMSPILPPLLTSVMEDEPSSVITGEDEQEQHQHQHQHIEHNQYVYDYMTEGASVISAARSRVSRSSRSQRGVTMPKHHTMVRHTLATSQQVVANPATMLKHLFIIIEEERHMHRLTAQHLRAVYNWLLFLPAILLTLISGVVILVFEADLNLNNGRSDTIQVYSSIAVGILSLISVFWQGLCKQLDFGVQSALHASCAIALKRISEDILLTLSAAAVVETIPAEYVALIGEKYEQAADSCATPTSCTIPYKLEAAFSTLSNRMRLMLQPPPTIIMMGGGNASVQKLDLLRLYATAYDELSSHVINYYLFPFIFPDPRRASGYALRNFKTFITEGKEIDRSCSKQYCCKYFCPCFDSPDEERSLFDVLSAPPAPPPPLPPLPTGVPIERQSTQLSF